ncbi:Ku protein (plasmid) [Streptomyces sp. QHH-9511]|uniref:non-homologous end joining protein Ku n=1 Tax=Streptomyces sp. QHH-9511 TaxID=2684468 RepID=UPI001316F9C8|nr:Ku protein [Streptomyces sp. QHH-9511]QGZ53314.1 Ku protein [Streptomyces sp. QHH-9511]
MPGRPIWSGAVSFGLVTIPVRLEPATESHGISFNQIHLADGGRIRYRKVCEIDGKELTQDDIGKGYEVSKDNVIPITDDELAQMPLPTAKAIDIVAFVDRESIDPIQLGEGNYYLTADNPVSAKPYVLLQKALERTDKVAIAKFALRGRERLGMLRVKGDALLLNAMHWPDEIRSSEPLTPGESDISEQEIEGALALMDTMSVEHLDDLELTDHYREALAEILEAKAEDREPRPVEAEEAPTGRVVDLMSALEESVAKAKASREATGTDATVHEMPKPKKTAAKKTAAKKTTAKKTARKRAS